MRISKELFGFNHFSGFDALLMCVWTMPVLMYNLRGVVSRVLGSVGETFFLPLLIIICVFASLNYMRRHIKPIDVVFVLLCVAYFYFCYYYYYNNQYILDEIQGKVLLGSLPLFFVGLCVNIEKSERMLFTLSVICVFLKALAIFINGGITHEFSSADESESMSAAHNVLPYVLMVLWIAFRDGGLLNVLLSLFSVLFILSLGNRGALFGVLVYTISYYMFFKKYKHPLRSRFLVATIGGVLFLFLKPLMLVLYAMFSSIGVSTRIFAKFLEDNIADDNGRDAIYDFMKNNIDQGPFFGYGLVGDRGIAGDSAGWSHNIFLEMQMTFGKFPGALLFGLLVLLLLIAFRKTFPNFSAQFLLLLFSTCSILIFSNSFIEYPMFFLMLGYCVQCLRYRKEFV